MASTLGNNPTDTAARLTEIEVVGNNAGYMFRNAFPASTDTSHYFDALTEAHKFQALRESDKPDVALRTGVYLTEVTEDDDGDRLFHLLRCSSNLAGPTENFRDIDREIITRVTELAKAHFKCDFVFNHVLAQVYHSREQTKARIGCHADKTKDMQPDGLMAFCTFYDRVVPTGSKVSPWTSLRFKLKNADDVKTDTGPVLPQSFTVELTPNSVLIIPLLTNRLYTHEISPSALPADRLPLRLGYVIRCSKTQAVYCQKDKQVHIQKAADGTFTPLRALDRVSPLEVHQLRFHYMQENSSTKTPEYGDVDFSLNEGDYMEPRL